MADEKAETQTAKLQFHYIKGPTYREVFCTGVIGGMSADGKLWMGIFAERGPIPRVVEFEVPAPEGSETVEFNEGESKPSRIESRPGVIRHLEVSAHMDLETAKKVHQWLGDQLKKAGK